MRAQIGFVLVVSAFAGAVFGDGVAGGETVSPDLARQTRAIAEDVARLRGLALRREVPIRTLSRAAFVSMLREKVAAELPAAKARGLERALLAFGWVDPPFDVRQAFIDLVSGQAAAVYDPETDEYLFIEGVTDPQLVDMISSHELVHALADQHFDLDALLVRPAREGRLTEDEVQALRFVVEGDATYVMMRRALSGSLAGLAAGSGSSDGKAREADEATLGIALRATLSAIVEMPYSAQVEAMLSGAEAAGGEFRAAVASLDSLPVVLVRPLLDAYLRGALLVADLRARGGWAAVDSLYRNPPASTEQVLHPEKLHPQRDAPRRPVLGGLGGPAGLAGGKGGDRISFEDTLGELYVRTLFEANGMSDAAAGLAAGWDGDRIAVIDSDTTWSALWVTVWDTEEEASAFESGLERLTGKRAGAEPRGGAPDSEGWKEGKGWNVRGRPTLIGRRGDRVAIAQSGDMKSAESYLGAALLAGVAPMATPSGPSRQP